MDPLWSETCRSTFKYFIILIVSTYYILCISWTIKYLYVDDARCKHEDMWSTYSGYFKWSILHHPPIRNYKITQQTSLRFVLLLKSLHCVRLLNTIHGLSSGPTETYRTMPVNRLWLLVSKVLAMQSIFISYDATDYKTSYGLSHLQP